MGKITADRLIDACGDDARAAGMTIRADIEPLAGPGAPVKPAIYEGGRYQKDERWHGDGDDRRRVRAIVIDNTQSQANRHETALLGMRERLGLPEITLDLTGLEPLPAHLPRRLSSLQFPHRHADAYLRDAELDGAAFLKSEVGQSLLSATVDRADALFEWSPQSLLYGFWQSHMGKKGTQAKLARSWTSEIVGYEPPEQLYRHFGMKGDALNLSIDGGVQFDENDPTAWESADKKGAKKLSTIGHGQVPFMRGDDGGEGDMAAPAAVSFRSIEQRATVSFAGLRRIRVSDDAANAAARALLASLGIVGHVGSFGRSFTLRSRCDLRTVGQAWTFLGDDEDEEIVPPTIDEAVELFHACADAARTAGLPVGPDWPSPLLVQPNASLAGVIRKSWPELS